MNIFAETEPLILRELLPTDEAGLFELDSDPEVHRYLGRNPLTNIQQSRDVIAFIRQQYINNGIGRWAVIEKTTGNFIGWCGLKLTTEMVNNHINFYDIGYRFIKRYWGKGYATESALAALNYGFVQLQLNEIYGMADIGNASSNHVLQKIGLKFVNTFDYDGDQCNWYQSTPLTLL
ncbi:GNAT family N-acetyltransferase [Mucilaginibacter paludis]|uniref:GCN5-related N-acetyltransferase n=1 Tax=Mucilaginibacter paludis DSM 18603 TaxID=714943 RepID=H1YAT5_9SPHI|nr:GNAT family N-acetyltransferase [Mucilaginibacter paludis]EHQ29544.1 GCN5-related N-acetyltransferase [Mucilaginibacter paludis DSM 18603]